MSRPARSVLPARSHVSGFRVAGVILCLASLVTLSGCDYGLVFALALRPWFDNQAKVFDPRLLGTWENVSERYVVLRDARSTYYIGYWSDGEETPYHAVLGKIGDRYYLDERIDTKGANYDAYYWGKPSKEGEFSDCLELLTTTHFINRIEFDAGKMRVRLLDAERLSGFLSSPDSTRRQELESVEVPCDSGDGRILLLVSETMRLQRFLAQYGDVDSLWDDGGEFRKVGP